MDTRWSTKTSLLYPLSYRGFNISILPQWPYFYMLKSGMEIIEKELSLEELVSLRKKYGDYVKLTVDLKNEKVVAGISLHTDGEKILLEKGGKRDNIWGGGIDFLTKKVSMAAVLNVRPRLGNDSLEILDSKKREKFQKIVEKYFKKLWL